MARFGDLLNRVSKPVLNGKFRSASAKAYTDFVGHSRTVGNATNYVQGSNRRASDFMRKHPGVNRVGGFASKHPVASAIAAGGVVGGVGGPMGGGPRTSRRNQNDYYLRQMRSSATQGIIPRSIGGMTG